MAFAEAAFSTSSQPQMILVLSSRLVEDQCRKLQQVAEQCGTSVPDVQALSFVRLCLAQIPTGQPWFRASSLQILQKKAAMRNVSARELVRTFERTCRLQSILPSIETYPALDECIILQVPAKAATMLRSATAC